MVPTHVLELLVLNTDCSTALAPGIGKRVMRSGPCPQGPCPHGMPPWDAPNGPHGMPPWPPWHAPKVHAPKVHAHRELPLC